MRKHLTGWALAVALAGPLVVASTTSAQEDISATARAAQPTQADDDAPTVQDVLARAIDAMGGRAAFEALESHALKGLQIKRSKEFPYELSVIPPDKVMGVYQSPIGPVVMARVGETGWVKAGMMKTMSASRDQIAPVEDLGMLPRIVFDLERNFEIAPVVDSIPYENRPSYRLTLQRRIPRAMDGGLPHFAIFDVETGRIVAFEQSIGKPRGGYSITRFREWKEFGDLKLFTRTYGDERGAAVEFRIESVEFNAVDEATFAIPDEVSGGAGD